jgi:dTDP-4-amino-4,6-dideoxyglucose formyltransferase
MSQIRVLAIADNLQIYYGFKKILEKKHLKEVEFIYRYSYNNEVFAKKFNNSKDILPINLKTELSTVIDKYDLVLSLHSKQIFPESLLKSVRCVNFHPGLNPHNRGWFPQVFSMMNGLPIGATIHEIDPMLDHGDIIAQTEITLYPYDTSYTAYQRILRAELKLINDNIESIIFNLYKSTPITHEGNINYKKDFNRLLQLDLNETGTLGYFINKLRAVSHRGYKNAYYIDEKTGKKVFVRLDLIPDKKNI